MSRLVDEIKSANPQFTEEQAFTSVMSHLTKVAQEGGRKADDLAKLITFVKGDNEAKAELVDAALVAEAKAAQEFPAADPATVEPTNLRPLDGVADDLRERSGRPRPGDPPACGGSGRRRRPGSTGECRL